MYFFNFQNVALSNSQFLQPNPNKTGLILQFTEEKNALTLNKTRKIWNKLQKTRQKLYKYQEFFSKKTVMFNINKSFEQKLEKRNRNMQKVLKATKICRHDLQPPFSVSFWVLGKKLKKVLMFIHIHAMMHDPQKKSFSLKLNSYTRKKESQK